MMVVEGRDRLGRRVRRQIPYPESRWRDWKNLLNAYQTDGVTAGNWKDAAIITKAFERRMRRALKAMRDQLHNRETYYVTSS